MKKNEKKSLSKKLIEASLKTSANSTTCGCIYQPKVPAKLKTYSKIEKSK